MSLHYVIDGYNVIKQVHFLTGKKLRNGREGLVRFIERYRPHGSKRNEITLVFDGKTDVSSPDISTSIRIIFSKDDTADEKIKAMVEASSTPKRLVVVSDDKQIMFYCRSIGAQVMSVKEFMNNADIPSRGLSREAAKEKPDLSSDVAAKITEELRNIWLKK